jgi:tyrosine-specific transport protein
MINSKLIGGILLIVGTSIGGGMLALPVSTSEVGFTNSLFFLFLCWLVMTAGALLILEVNLRLPAGSNMISMAKKTLGLPGQIVAWVSYLLLLYTLLSAYISGGSDIFSVLLQRIHISLPSWAAAILFTTLFGFIVYKGIRSVDYINRGLMFGKLGIYLLLLAIISPHISLSGLTGGSVKAFASILMILATSFGFATIIPSLRDYFEDDVQALRRMILLGSLIPLVCYILWDAVIMGVVSREGDHGLMALMQSEHATSGLIEALGASVKNQWISHFFDFFTSICMLTAFLGVSLGLFDFLADGFKLKKSGRQGSYTLMLTFIPPLAIVLFHPGIYLHALSYAGICCIVLLLLLPVLMAWKGRQQALVNADNSQMMIPGGNMVLGLIGLFGLGLLFVALT